MNVGKWSAESVEALVPYATPAQARCLLAFVGAKGNLSHAAQALNFTRSSVQKAIRGAANRAARRGFAPAHGWNPPAARSEPVGTVPDGFKVWGVSDLVTGDGTRDRAWIKSREAPDPEAHGPLPEGFIPTRISEGKDGNGNTFARWTAYSPKEADRWQLMLESARQACLPMVGSAGTAPALEAECDDETMAVYGFGDPHIGMLANAAETGAADFDLKIAEEQTTAVVRRLVDCAPASRVALLVLIGDNFHADDDRQVTPGHGHKLDVDTRASKVFRVGCRLWRTQIDRMLTKHQLVRVNVTRGNHDPLTSFFMAEWLRAIYANEPRVEVLDNVREHQYILFGGCLIAMTHGHKTKPDGLAGVMAADVPDMWAAATACRHWITGHIHSKTWWDFRGCSLETLRTLCPSDAYAAGAGYRSSRDSVVITFHKRFGEIARSTVNLARAGVAA